MLVSTAWLAEHAADKDLVILHSGDAASYGAKHIAGARLAAQDGLSITGADGLTLEMPPAEALRGQLQALGVSDNSRIVVYSAGPQIQAATRIMMTLDAAGLGARASLLDGGLAEWERTGHATTTEAAVVKAGDLKPLTIKAGKIVDAEFTRTHATAPGYDVVDARASAFYDGAQAGVGGVKGHIPGAKSIPFTSLTTPDGKLKPSEELAAIFKSAGVNPGDHLVAYCHVGQQATAVIFAARTLGIDATLYDGSFQEWSKKGLPVEPVAAAVTAPK
jgi:thiosulfate/3-mercaptopyruvate sulfurtransferase